MCKLSINSADPTKLGGVRNKAMVEFRKRLAAAQKVIVQFIESLNPKVLTIPNAPAINKNIYIYELDATRLEDLNAFIKSVLDEMFFTGQQRTFLTQYVTQGYMKGATSTIGRLHRLAADAGESPYILAQLEIDNVTSSPEFQRRIGLVLARTFNSMEKFSGDLGIDLGRVIADGMTRGISPRQIATTIKNEFDVKQARAMTIARTEVNNALRSAKTDEVKAVRNDLDLDVRVLHMSALLPERTRKSHAARHGKIYTVEEEEAFYAVDGNAVNCYCSQTEIVVRSDGTVFDAGLIEKLKQERKTFLGLAD